MIVSIQKHFSNKMFFLILGLTTLSLSIRIYLYPQDLPLSMDALNAYFLYANDTRILGHFPVGLANNGWPGFLSLFFSMFQFDTAIQYMNVQRIVSISFSLLTVIPIYFIGKKFFDAKYAILGVTIFVFEPRLIQNSLLGITEPMYLFLIALSLSLFFAGNKKTYISFIVIGLASIVRSEGLFLLFGVGVVLIIQNRKEIKKLFKKLIISVTLFIGAILPISVIRIMVNGGDSVVGRAISEGGKMVSRANHETTSVNLLVYFFEGMKTPIMLLGWASIPLFVFFVPASIISIIKDRSKDHSMLIIITGFMMIPTFYGLSIGPDTRYILPLYPLFSIMSIYIIKRILKNKNSKNILFVIIIASIILASSIFIVFKHTDLEYEREAFEIAKKIMYSNGMNDYGDEGKYLRVVGFVDEYPSLTENLNRGPPTFDVEESSIENFIDKYREEGLEHIVVDSSVDPIFLNLYNNEDEYDYLNKVYDSSHEGYKYLVKMFEIDYYTYDKMN